MAERKIEAVRADLHDQIGMDLAKHAADRSSRAMLDALALCDTTAQGLMVAISVVSTLAAQASGVIAKHIGIDASEIDPPEMMEIIAGLLRHSARPLPEDAE